MNGIRAFFCIELPRPVREQIRETADRIRDAATMRARWVDAANYHATIKFLGDIDPMLCVDLERIARRVAGRLEPFELALDRLGGFPSIGRARVLWFGGDGPPSYRGLVASIGHELRRLDFPHRPSDGLAHVTLARINGRPDPALTTIVERVGRPRAVTVPVDRIVLMRSELTPAGARYAPLFTARLGGGDGDAD